MSECCPSESLSTLPNLSDDAPRRAEPSPQQIREACERIQAGWTDDDRQRRFNAARCTDRLTDCSREVFTVPVVSLAGLPADCEPR